MKKKPRIACLITSIFLLTFNACRSTALDQKPTTLSISTSQSTYSSSPTFTPIPPTVKLPPTSTSTSTPVPPIPTNTLNPTSTPLTPKKGAIFKSERVKGVSLWFVVDETGTRITTVVVRAIVDFYPSQYESYDLALPITNGQVEYETMEFQITNRFGQAPEIKEFLLQVQFDSPTTASGHLVMKTNSLVVPPYDFDFKANVLEKEETPPTPTK